MFIMVSNFVLPCFKLLALVFLFEILDVVPLLDVHQPQIGPTVCKDIHVAI
jgi:hypothetical protein